MKCNIFRLENRKCREYVARFSNRTIFISEFRKTYERIEAYHATNLGDKELAALRKEGLKVSSSNLLTDLANKRFHSNTDCFEHQEAIKIDIQNYFKGLKYVNEGEINFGLNKKQLKEEFYHYSLFGAETLLPLADILQKKFFTSFRKRMSDFGNHVIITAQIVTLDVEDTWLEGIFEYIYNGFPESSLVYYKDLLPCNIVKIEKLKRPVDRNGFLY